MGIYLGTNELGGSAVGGGGYIPGIIGFEYLALSGGGAGGAVSTYGGGGGGAGSLVHGFAYAQKDVTLPIAVGAGGSNAKGGDTIIGEGLLVTTILGGGQGTYNGALTDNFGTCPGGAGSTTSTQIANRKGNGFTAKGNIIGLLDTASVNGSAKLINDTTTPFTNGYTNGFSGPGGAGLGGSAPTAAYNSGNVGGIGLDPTTITDRFLTQAEYQTEGIGEVTSSVAYIGGGGSGRTSSRANPPGGGGARNVAGLANTGGGGGTQTASGGSGFAMLRLPTSQSVTTVGVSNTYTKGDDTVYVWKSTGSITINS